MPDDRSSGGSYQRLVKGCVEGDPQECWDRLQIMAMGQRGKPVRQEGLWTPTAALLVSASHPIYQRCLRYRLTGIKLRADSFDVLIEPLLIQDLIQQACASHR